MRKSKNYSPQPGGNDKSIWVFWELTLEFDSEEEADRLLGSQKPSTSVQSFKGRCLSGNSASWPLEVESTVAKVFLVDENLWDPNRDPIKADQKSLSCWFAGTLGALEMLNSVCESDPFGGWILSVVITVV